MEDPGISKGAFRVQIHYPPVIKIFIKKKGSLYCLRSSMDIKIKIMHHTRMFENRYETISYSIVNY